MKQLFSKDGVQNSQGVGEAGTGSRLPVVQDVPVPSLGCRLDPAASLSLMPTEIRNLHSKNSLQD